MKPTSRYAAALDRKRRHRDKAEVEGIMERTANIINALRGIEIADARQIHRGEAPVWH